MMMRVNMRGCSARPCVGWPRVDGKECRAGWQRHRRASGCEVSVLYGCTVKPSSDNTQK
jgi:hypothetical protein